MIKSKLWNTLYSLRPGKKSKIQYPSLQKLKKIGAEFELEIEKVSFGSIKKYKIRKDGRDLTYEFGTGFAPENTIELEEWLKVYETNLP